MTQFHKPDIELNRGSHQLHEHERVAQQIFLQQIILL